jgi:hypothetical protein
MTLPTHHAPLTTYPLTYVSKATAEYRSRAVTEVMMPSPQYHALVVDDEAPVRKLVALTKEGFACDLAADGVEALH